MSEEEKKTRTRKTGYHRGKGEKYKNFYTTTEICGEFIKIYHLENLVKSTEVNSKGKNSTEEAVYKEIVDACKNLKVITPAGEKSLWDITDRIRQDKQSEESQSEESQSKESQSKESQSKKSNIPHVFTEEEKMLLLRCERLKKYGYGRAPCKIKTEYDKAQEEADKLNEEYRHIQEAKIHDYVMEVQAQDIGPTISYDELLIKKLELMIEALYLQHFEEIDMDELLRDMYEVAALDATGYTAEYVIADKHLQAGSKYYCKKRTASNEEEAPDKEEASDKEEAPDKKK